MYALCSLCLLLIIILILIKYNEKSQEKFTNYSYDGIKSNSDTPWTIEKSTKLVITDILRKIINTINDKTGMSYVFTAYDQLSQEVLCPARTRFTADIFIHEMRNLETRRIIVIFVVNFASKQVDVEYVNLSNAFKLPETQFMSFAGPELILQDDNLLRNEYHIMGLSNSKIEFSILRDDEGKPKKVNIPDGEFQKWILPMGIDAAATGNPQNMFQHKIQSKCWGTDGANYGNKTSKQAYPYDNPTINRQRDWNTEYKGMFDLVDSRSAIGGGLGVAGSP